MLISIAHMCYRDRPKFTQFFRCHHIEFDLNYFLQVSAESQFEYAWCLVRSRYPADIRKGIILLEDLFQVKQ